MGRRQKDKRNCRQQWPVATHRFSFFVWKEKSLCSRKLKQTPQKRAADRHHTHSFIFHSVSSLVSANSSRGPVVNRSKNSNSARQISIVESSPDVPRSLSFRSIRWFNLSVSLLAFPQTAQTKKRKEEGESNSAGKTNFSLPPIPGKIFT